MKKVITVIIALFFSTMLFAQIQMKESVPRVKVGEVKTMGSTIAELSYSVMDADTLYNLLYHNLQYQHISDYKSVSFSGQDGTLNQLYEIMTSVFKDENKKNKDYKVDFKLGEEDVTVGTIRVMGNTGCMFFVKNKGYTTLSEKQVNQLFGKK